MANYNNRSFSFPFPFSFSPLKGICIGDDEGIVQRTRKRVDSPSDSTLFESIEDELEVVVSGLFGRLVGAVEATAADIMLTDKKSTMRKTTRWNQEERAW